MATKRNSFLLFLVVGSTIAMAVVLIGLWQAVFWAIILGILFMPLMEKVKRSVPGRAGLAAALTLALIVIFVLTPAFIIGSMIAGEAISLYARIESGEVNLGPVFTRIERELIPTLGDWAARLGVSGLGEKLQATIVNSGQFLVGLLLGASQSAASFVVNFFLMLYLLFFILRDGKKMSASVMRTLPLPTSQKDKLFVKFGEVAIATLKGSVVVGLVQGSLGALIFFLLGIQGAAFWGAIMAVVSILPVLGAALVWVPAAIILVASGAWIQGAILIGFGIGVIATSDNIVRPLIVGHDTKMPDYLVLFSTVGGLSVLGISGIVLGPVLAALFLVTWQLWSETHEDISA